ncbi:MAG: hypothetical protein MZW92_53005 [Comamonadaceae bacterium]|nr:hypothetical protein [Comamonadaceae bacterium]
MATSFWKAESRQPSRQGSGKRRYQPRGGAQQGRSGRGEQAEQEIEDQPSHPQRRDRKKPDQDHAPEMTFALSRQRAVVVHLHVRFLPHCPFSCAVVIIKPCACPVSRLQ